MAAAKLFHSAGQQVTVPTYLVPATQKVPPDACQYPWDLHAQCSQCWLQAVNCKGALQFGQPDPRVA